LTPNYVNTAFKTASCYYYIRQPRRALEYCDLLLKLDKHPTNRKARDLKTGLEKILGVKK
jgi:hypothetical protein